MGSRLQMSMSLPTSNTASILRAAKSPQSLTFVSYQTPAMKPLVTRKHKRTWRRGADSGSTVSKIRNACITCREKKTRCSGHQPCIRCKQNAQVCQYMPTTSTQTSDGNWMVRNPHASTPFGTASSTINHSRASRFSEESDPENHQNLLSHGIKKVDTPDETLQEDQNGHIHGGASEFSFMQLAKQRLLSLPAVSIDFSDHPLPHPKFLTPTLPPKATADQLIARYFDFGLSTSRLVHKRSLTDIVDRMYNGEECNSDDLALAYIVLALGSHYSNLRSNFCGFSASVRFYTMARAQLEEVPDLVTLATSQTRLLIILYLLNHARMHEAWWLFGIVIRHIQALGLHRCSQLARTNPIRYECRKRLFWCVYIYDRILSSMFGRPLAIHDDDIDQEECALANDEDIEESRCRLTENGAFCLSAGLVHYARLARILGQILKGFYTPSARLQDISQLYVSASQFEKALQEWQKDLPPYLNYVVLPQSAVSMTAQRQMCTLKLMFAHASLLLYRPFILHAIDKKASQTSKSQWIKRCHEKSIEAANTVVSECSYLSNRGLFSREFWLVTYMQFASIGTLLMYSYLWPEDTSVRRTAEEAINEFPAGIDGDPVGQRYLATLKELREITAGPQTSLFISDSLFDTSTGLRIEPIGIESADEVPWTNFFFDTSLIDDAIGHNGNE
ncbi:fungal-specific transcription factor domain-containing protein [Xylaria telfairii]|nr:fungal-specific transcription factor domain-containing protein [Xylaria telfairii]